MLKYVIFGLCSIGVAAALNETIFKKSMPREALLGF